MLLFENEKGVVFIYSLNVYAWYIWLKPILLYYVNNEINQNNKVTCLRYNCLWGLKIRWIYAPKK